MVSIQTGNTLTGKVHSKEFFCFFEDSKINTDKIVDVLSGKIAGCIFRGVIPKEVCKKIAVNFWQNQLISQRLDNVPAIYLGTYHYEKDLKTYLKEVEQTKAELLELFKGTENIFNSFIHRLTISLKKNNILLRIAQHKKKQAGSFLMRSWNNLGEYSLSPHEDSAQCYSLKQKGFEIQSTINYEIVAVNFCIENNIGGSLHYWNIQPNDNDRKNLGLEETGYPYPQDLLINYEKIVLPIYTGDIYCFNGRNIHAVDKINKLSSPRSTISFFTGFKDDKTAIYWT